MATGKQKRIKACDYCGQTGLVWGKTPEGWRLCEPTTINGNLAADLSKVHNCRKEGSGGSGDTPTPEGPITGDDVVRLVCACAGVRGFYAYKEDVLRVGYPICSTCESFFVVASGPAPTAKDVTPETITV